MEQVIEEIKKAYASKFFYKLYADDLVVIIKHKFLPRFLKIMAFYFKKYSLIFNAKKSAISCIKNHKKIKFN